MSEQQVPVLSGPRLPYHPAVEARFGVDKAAWKALVEAVFPAAESAESVILALSYCKARNLDVFKRPVHIVPIWSSEKRCMVDTIWPGIGELRTTAFRTGAYAGMDPAEFGEVQTKSWTHRDKKGKERLITVEFPEWAQVTVYRMVQGQRVPFPGPRVYWLETYARMGKSPAPNSMWETRPMGQIGKCAEAAALRAAFPEEVGESFTPEEVRIIEDVHNMPRDEGKDLDEESEVPRRLSPKGLDALADQLESKEQDGSEEVGSGTRVQRGTENEQGPTDPDPSLFEEDLNLETDNGL